MVTSRVIKKGDARILEINGAPALPYGYLSYHPEELARDFAGAGVHRSSRSRHTC